VLIEAISMGIPVLATDVGGCREIAHAQTGLLVSSDPDPKELAAKVDAFLQSDQNTAHFRAGVRRYWENHFRLEDNLLKFVQTAKQTA
jgi:glycosyltransferase involved in cell wall biosynthesis